MVKDSFDLLLWPVGSVYAGLNGKPIEGNAVSLRKHDFRISESPEDEQERIVATDNGILYKMQHAAPHKKLIMAPTAGNSATCKSCAHCPWMAMNGLRNLAEALEYGRNEVKVDPDVGRKAKLCIDRMLQFAADKKANIRPSGDLAADQTLFKGIGPA